jgi:hypothetical protein
MHDLEALGLELQQQRRERDRGRVLKIMQHDHALAALVELGHHRCDHLVAKCRAPKAPASSATWNCH